ncbi:nuclear transport factor 2 family protein [Rhodococcus sp. ARC_M6]|uniref:nuclear transport factor 2 family protein n=1 Tax=Rhodococcus sp. ARC_M6 TaxID=2928852 RepID=UPI001FB2DE19|nr:nuclear transport factor 2 family protein [Rhodococcus sp. ARC_M6]MCJ0905419.1 nuclear transport factor 2 family protein [Rhodococcus sp. ARC_M6]
MTDGDIATRMDDVEARLRRLEDCTAATGLLHRYAAALDNPVPELVAGLFTADGILSTGRGEYKGHDAIADFYRTVPSFDPSEKRHFIALPNVASAGDGVVEIEAYFTYIGRDDDASRLGWGLYRDTVLVNEGQALFSSMVIEMHFNGNLNQGWPRRDRS